MALGGDQGGSVRIPASWCGIVGLKPTWGLVPYTGAIPIEITIDHLGPMANTVTDCALLLEVIRFAILVFIYSQISISRSCGDYFCKFELPEVQINLHFG